MSTPSDPSGDAVRVDDGSGPHPDVTIPGRWTGDPDDWSELVRACGGSDDSWTGIFLRLVAKSDPLHMTALRRAAPGHVAAWLAWRRYADGSGAGVDAARAAFERQEGPDGL